MSRVFWRRLLRMIRVMVSVAEDEDPDNAPPPGMDDAQLFALIAEAREFTAEQAAAEAEMARAGRAGSGPRSGRWRPAAGARGCPAPRAASR